MLTTLLVLAALPWVLILLYQISRRGFVILLIWLLIAPIVTYFVERAGQGVVFQTSGIDQGDIFNPEFYYQGTASIQTKDLAEPTRILFSAFLAVFILNGIVKKKRPIPFDTTEKWMSIFALILLGNVFLWSGRLAYGLHVAVDAFIIPFVAYFLSRRLVTSEHRFHQLIRVIGYMGCYVVVYCLIERFTTPGLVYRLRGLFESSNTLHPVLAVAFFGVLLSSCDEESPALPRYLRRFVLCLAPVIVALTYVRGNWVGFFAGVGTFLLLGRRLSGISQQSRVIGLTLVFGLIVGLGVSLFLPEAIENRITRPENLLGRFATWIATIEIGAKAPILGVGLNNLHGLLIQEVVYFGEYTNYTTPHNTLLSLFAELGVVGLVVYLAVITRIIKMGVSLYRTGAHPQDRWRGLALVAIMVAYSMPSLFANTMYTQGLIHIYVYVFGGAIAGIYGNAQPRFLSHISSGRPLALQSEGKISCRLSFVGCSSNVDTL